MEEDTGDFPSAQDHHYYPLDLYGSDRLPLFPGESPGPRGGRVRAGRSREAQGSARAEEDADELVRLSGLEDDQELGGELVQEHVPRIQVSEYPDYSLRWGPGEGVAGAEELGPGGWGPTGQSQELRAAYRYTHGRASEEYECYVIPEEEDEEEAADVFCVTCRAPHRASELAKEEHRDHEVMPLSEALESAKEELHRNMFKLEKQIIDMENFASHLEEVFITVEENFGRQEQNFESHYNGILETLAQKYEAKVQALGEKKRAKLDALYGQLLSCGENLDACRRLMESIEDMCHQEKVAFMQDAVAMADRLGKFLQTKTNVEISEQPDFEDQTLDFSDVEQLMGSIHSVPAPSAPVINPQAPNSATGSSVRVCWSLYSDDTVESYQLTCRPVCELSPGQGPAEFTLTVKETYCSVTDLMPNTQYELWVTAHNRTGPSPASERVVYTTAPAPPIIKRRELRSCEQAAFICWASGNLNPVDSYTVEITPLDTPDNLGITESVVGIPSCESLVQLQPGHSYSICVRAVSIGGPSAPSQPVTVCTTGSCFPLNPHTCHPWLSLSEEEDGLLVIRREKGRERESPLRELPPGDTRFSSCVAVMGSLIPVRGRHYWEVEVDEGCDYTVGVASEGAPRQEDLGAGRLSWCMRHTQMSSRRLRVESA
ncbi:fibronectin type III and SPRY domain-containing protein 2 isoform X2 [Erinaceus europaeus]|uniref:Fibronectin type III and SPRY domain-containing protein 2 isoform X2 n=1 Tax=Erinaceus europaeus TaxID=9365 RepID=A0ABM3WG07_ERIEU|nr:fibronectin type III and SPRY domain-containing protein 2 isoform X2 [Erinaceus europaeus]